jgi:hypothetical protein
MGSDTLSGTPGNQIGYAISEVKSGFFSSGWEVGAPPLGNGVMWLMSTPEFQANQPPNFAFTFYYTFINTGPAVTGATMSCGVDNSGYIVLNGVKYPSTNVNINIGYEGIVTVGSFTVNIPPGLNTLELRVVNHSSVPTNTTWQNQGLPFGGPTAAWLAITSGSTVLVKTTGKWRCTEFYYPAKFIGPVSLADVAENAGLSAPYSLAALAGKRMYDNATNATILSLPVSLGTAIGKTFIAPSWTSTVFNTGLNGNWYAWDARVPTTNGTYSCRAVASGDPSKVITWTCTVSGGSANVSGLTLTNVNNGGNPRIAWTTSFASGVANFNSFPYSGGGLVYFLIDLWYTTADATYILTVTRTS